MRLRNLRKLRLYTKNENVLGQHFIQTKTKGGSVYIMTNKLKTTLYIGVTSDLRARIRQHKNHFFKGSFTDKYNLEYCVYYENYFSIQEAILREKQIKKWSRMKKENLINSINPNWIDLCIEIEKW